MRIFIGSSSRDNIPLEYYSHCKDFLDRLFIDNHDLVFGANKHGLMGVSYDVASNNNRDIIGIYPNVYADGANEIDCGKILVKTVNERTEKLIETSDVLLFFPGGIGTIYELFVAIETKRAKEHDKPIIIYNCCDFYNSLILLLDKMYKEGFTSLIDEGYFYICSSYEEFKKYISGHKKRVRKI